MLKFANLISYVFHPLLMATYGCIIVFFGLSNSIYFIFTPLRVKMVITLTVLAFTFLLPVLNLLILYKMNYISSLKIDNGKERTFPLLITAFCYFGLFYLVYDFNIWPAIKLFILGGGICIFFATIINLWWKISAHMIGIGGMFGTLLALSLFLQMPIFMALSACILIAGCIGFARLYLKAHNPAQVYTGFAFGSIIQLSLFLLAQSFSFI